MPGNGGGNPVIPGRGGSNDMPGKGGGLMLLPGRGGGPVIPGKGGSPVCPGKGGSPPNGLLFPSASELFEDVPVVAESTREELLEILISKASFHSLKVFLISFS
mmetsp:Transcript_19623/g.36141  ORF Transcript_19623/g.36141 Transcript_19623/m.36141 type:complete len:104 (+) Transcript_19623:5246-5557(+)